MKILYVGHSIEKVQSGAEQVNKRNLDLLLRTFGEGSVKVLPVELSRSLYARFFFGVSRKFIKQVFWEIEQNSYDMLFLSHSLYGRVAKKVKKKFPEIIIIIFFHNIEKHYASELIATSGISHLPFYIAATHCEKMAVRHSDYLIVLNERDNLLLKKFYNTTASLQLPTSFVDKFEKERIMNYKKGDEVIYLFVGVAFFANIQGIQWFIENVFPHIPGKLFVVGKGMKAVLKNSERIQVWDYVEDLSDLYYQANFVILPIFVGGGMKTKTAEALMYGKTILATNESLQGYQINEEAVYICDTKEEYIQTILKLIAENKIDLYNEKSRILFEKYCSFDSSMEHFKIWLAKENILK